MNSLESMTSADKVGHSGATLAPSLTFTTSDICHPLEGIDDPYGEKNS